MDISTLPLPQPPRRDAPSSVQVRLAAPLPAGLGNAPLTLKVVSSQPNGQARLALPDGTTLAATLSPPAAVGSSLTLPPPGNAVLHAVARLMPPPPAQPAPQAQPAVAPAPQLALQPPPNPLPQGPVLVVAPPNAPLPQGPVVLTVVGQPDAAGQQAAVAAQPPGRDGAPSAEAIRVLLNAGLPLPVGSRMTVTVPTQPPAQGGAPVAAQAVDVSLPLVTPQGQVVQTAAPAPVPPAFLSALKVLAPPAPAAPPQQQGHPPQAPMAARVMAPPAPLAAGGSAQPILLANGQPAMVQLPSAAPPAAPGAAGPNPLPTGPLAAGTSLAAGLPQGSVLVVEFSSFNGAGRVTQVDPAGGTTPTGVNSGGTGSPQAHTQAAAGVAPQTLQAVLAPGQVVTGLVTGQNPQAQQITVTLPLPPGAPELAQPTTLTLHTPTQLPVGTQVSVRIGTVGPQGLPQGTLLAVTLPGNYYQSQALAGFAQRWDTLQAGLAALRGQNPAAAASLAARLPHLAALGATLLPYMEALQRNDPARAFGREELAMLRALGRDVGADFSQMQSLGQPTPEGWRGMLFPYLETPSSDPRQGGFFWRRQKNEDDPEKPASTRFVVQLGLSQLGEVQLDGLLAYPELWLKLRRKTASEPGFVQNLQKVVDTTLQALGLQGGIAVETTDRFVDPAGEILSHAAAKLSTEA